MNESSTKTEKNLDAVSVMKAIMMVTVVLGHSCIVFQQNNWGGVIPATKSGLLSTVVQFLATFHTYSFVFASGYLFSYQRYSRGKYRDLFIDIRHRATRLLVPYCVFAVLWAGPIDVLLKGISIKEALHSYFFVLSAAQLWFLVMLFLEYLFFYFASDFIIKLPVGAGLSLFIIIRLIVSVIERKIPIGIFSISNALRYMIVYYLGMLWERRKLRIPQRKGLIGILIMDIAVFICYVNWFLESVPVVKEVFTCLLNVLGVLCVAGVSCLVCEQIKERTLYKKIASASMGVYLFHQQIIYMFLHTFSPNLIPPVLYSLLCFVIAFLISYFLTIMFRKFRVGRFALGEG